MKLVILTKRTRAHGFGGVEVYVHTVARTAVEVAVTAVDGVRERFRLRLAEPEAVWHFDSLLEHVFRTPRPAIAA